MTLAASRAVASTPFAASTASNPSARAHRARGAPVARCRNCRRMRHRPAEALAVVAASFRNARFPRPGAVSGATREGDDVELTFVIPASADPLDDDVAEMTCVAAHDETLLAVAMRCGAVDASDAARFCLEGRCDACMMEDVTDEGDGEPVRACQTTVGESPARIFVGAGDDAPWGADLGWDDDDDDGHEDGETGPEDWEKFEGSKYYRE
jgi:hypothetical protein